MNIRVPQPTQAAQLLKRFFQEQGISVQHSQALEAVARLHGYQSWQSMKADTRFAEAPALSAQACDEYALRASQPAVWVEVDNISVYIRRNDEGVSVDLYPSSRREEESVAGTSMFFHEAADEEQDDSGGAEHDENVNWQQIAELDSLTFVRVSGGELRKILFLNRKGLRDLSQLSLLKIEDQVRLRSEAGIVFKSQYGSKPEGIEISLGQLKQAAENQEGVIRLADGRTLELFVDDGEGVSRYSSRFDSFSPKTDSV